MHGGSYSEYLVAPAHMLITLPDFYSFEDAAQLGISAFTTCQMLWESQVDLPKLFEEPKASEQPTLLVWSGATATGHYVIQYAKLARIKVITTSSPKHFDRLRNLGADLCFDYNDQEVTRKIREATGNDLRHAADCMSETETLKLVNDCMGDKGGVISAIRSGISEGANLQKNVTVRVSMSYNLLGEVRSLPFLCFVLLNNR
jgi:NADPH:quinone reductase-like Zn-dependent oxidoreductase